MMGHRRVAVREDAFLVVIDVQEPLMRVIRQPEVLLRGVLALIEAAKTLGLPILATEQNPQRLGPTVEPIRSAWGAVSPMAKMAFSCCGSEPFRNAMTETGRKTAVVCGVEAHVCVSQTVHDLLAEGLSVHVAADAVSSRTEANRNLALEKMRGSGAVISSVEMVVYEMMERAGTPEFRSLLPLFR